MTIPKRKKKKKKRNNNNNSNNKNFFGEIEKSYTHTHTQNKKLIAFMQIKYTYNRE